MKVAILLTVLPLGAVAQISQNPCPTADPCIPLLFHPADGSPERTVTLPVTFGPPTTPLHTPKTRGAQSAANRKEFDFGFVASYLDPDYGHSVDISTGVFASFTGHRFGAEGRADYTAVARDGKRENTITAGPRINVLDSRNLTLFASAEFGAGHLSGDPANPSNRETIFVESYGGGVDLHLSRRVNFRLVDGSYQIWPGFTDHHLTPFSYGSGLGIRF